MHISISVHSFLFYFFLLKGKKPLIRYFKLQVSFFFNHLLSAQHYLSQENAKNACNQKPLCTGKINIMTVQQCTYRNNKLLVSPMQFKFPKNSLSTTRNKIVRFPDTGKSAPHTHTHRQKKKKKDTTH